MKKILILICIFLNGCVLDPYNDYFEDTVYEHYKMEYKFSDGNQYTGNFMHIYLPYQLPTHRTKDFLGTLSLILTSPELNNNITMQIMNSIGTDVSYDTSFHVYLNEYNKPVFNSNSNFDMSIVDPTNINYYSATITYNETWHEIKNTVQIHLRQELSHYTTIKYMVMIKPHNSTEYKYLKHTVLDNFVTEQSIYEGIPLPSILK